MRAVIVALMSAAMIMSPSYLASLLMSRPKMEISIIPILSLVIFLIGVFLLVRLLKD